MIVELNPETEQGQKAIEQEYERQFAQKIPKETVNESATTLLIYGLVIAIALLGLLVVFIKA